VQKVFSENYLSGILEVDQFLNDLIEEGWKIEQFQYTPTEEEEIYHVVVLVSKMVTDNFLDGEWQLYNSKLLGDY